MRVDGAPLTTKRNNCQESCVSLFAIWNGLALLIGGVEAATETSHIPMCGSQSRCQGTQVTMPCVIRREWYAWRLRSRNDEQGR